MAKNKINIEDIRQDNLPENVIIVINIGSLRNIKKDLLEDRLSLCKDLSFELITNFDYIETQYSFLNRVIDKGKSLKKVSFKYYLSGDSGNVSAEESTEEQVNNPVNIESKLVLKNIESLFFNGFPRGYNFDLKLENVELINIESCNNVFSFHNYNLRTKTIEIEKHDGNIKFGNVETNIITIKKSQMINFKFLKANQISIDGDSKCEIETELLGEFKKPTDLSLSMSHLTLNKELDKYLKDTPEEQSSVETKISSISQENLQEIKSTYNEQELDSLKVIKIDIVYKHGFPIPFNNLKIEDNKDLLAFYMKSGDIPHSEEGYRELARKLIGSRNILITDVIILPCDDFRLYTENWKETEKDQTIIPVSNYPEKELCQTIDDNVQELTSKHFNLVTIFPSPYRYIQGKKIRENVIIIGVQHKGIIKKGEELISKKLGNFETDIINAHLLSYFDVIDYANQQGVNVKTKGEVDLCLDDRHLTIGVPIFIPTTEAPKPHVNSFTTTLGCFIKENEKISALTSAHLLDPTRSIPCLPDQFPNNSGFGMIDVLTIEMNSSDNKFTPFVHKKIEINQRNEIGSRIIDKIKHYSYVESGEKVFKFGAKSGFTIGYIQNSSYIFTIPQEYSLISTNYYIGPLQALRCLLIHSHYYPSEQQKIQKIGSFAAPGDSGALIFNGEYGIGLVCGGILNDVMDIPVFAIPFSPKDSSLRLIPIHFFTKNEETQYQEIELPENEKLGNILKQNIRWGYIV